MTVISLTIQQFAIYGIEIWGSAYDNSFKQPLKLQIIFVQIVIKENILIDIKQTHKLKILILDYEQLI